jgi:mannose-6-phosphate isomerase-like protein (cupin superfamily)
MPDGYVVAAAEAPASAERRTIGPEQGCTELEQSVISLAPRGSAERATGAAEEVLYVLSGHGRIGEHAVAPETAVFMAPGERYAMESAGPEALELVSVRLPDPPAGDGGPRSAVLRLDEQDTGRATSDREFRLLADPSSGCRGASSTASRTRARGRCRCWACSGRPGARPRPTTPTAGRRPCRSDAPRARAGRHRACGRP